jgi:hypothetical protein
VRKRKRNALPADHWLRDTKYDTAMVVAVMSDDETAFLENGAEDTSQYISRPPLYRSEEVSPIILAIFDTDSGVCTLVNQIPQCP